MLWGGLVVGIISFFLNSYYSGKFLGYSSIMQLKDIAPSYGIATTIALSVWFLKYLPMSYWVILPLQIMVGLIVFFALCKMTKNEEYNEIKGMVTPVIQKLLKNKE